MNTEALRAQFPQLSTQVKGHPLVYFDNAATTLKPQRVLSALDRFNSQEVANIHRGAHTLGNRGTERFEATRAHVARFLNASSEEIIFTRGTTESLNLVAQTYGRALLQAGDEILLSEAEHHSNIVPWQLLARERGVVIRVLPVLDSGMWDLKALDTVLTAKTKLVAISQISNVTGLVYPVAEITRRAHAVGAVTAVDAAQSVVDMPVDVRELDCDFLAFSGHKLFGPFGVGVLYGRQALLEKMPPYQGGGSMIAQVGLSNETTFLPPPHRFEAGTPVIDAVVGLDEALHFVEDLGWSAIQSRKQQLSRLLEQAVREVPGTRIYGEGSDKAAICSFMLEGCHPSDVAHILDQQGVAVRAGHLCAQPLMAHWKVAGVLRASLTVYNTEGEIARFQQALIKAKELLT